MPRLTEEELLEDNKRKKEIAEEKSQREKKEEPKDLRDMNLQELKAMAFDYQMQLEFIQSNLRTILQQITEKSKN